MILSLISMPLMSFGASSTTTVFFSHEQESDNRLFVKTSYSNDTLTEAGVEDMSDFKIAADQLTTADGTDYEKVVAAKDSLEGDYEDRFIAVSYKTSVPEGIDAGEFEKSVQFGFQLAADSDEITGAYTSGEFANDFAGYYNGWDSRYWEMYYLSPEGKMTQLMSPMIIDTSGFMGGLYFGDYLENYSGYYVVGLNVPTVAVEGTLLIVQKKPTVPESLTDGVYHIPVDIWKTGSDEPSMGNDAVTDHMAVLEIKDGEWYVTLNWHAIEYTNLIGHILDLKYYESEKGYADYQDDRVEYGSALKEIEDVTYQSDETASRYVQSITVPFQPGDSSLYLNVMVDAMGTTRQDMRAKFIWDDIVKIKGWFYDLEDGEYDTDILMLHHSQKIPEEVWAEGHSYKDDGDIFGKKARVIVENGEIEYMYLSPVQSEKIELLNNSDKQLAYEDADGKMVYADILATEPSASGLQYEKITLAGFKNPKTTTDWMKVRHTVARNISSWNASSREYYLSVAYNDINGKNMVRIIGRTELGELLALAGEEADTAYAKQKAVYDNPVATQEELTAALDVMEKALSGQKDAKLEELKNVIQQAQDLNSDSYTETSFSALTEAIKAASAVAENPESTLAEIMQQISALAAAKEALVADVDWSALDAQIEAAENIRKSQYTTTSYQYMYNTLVEAREMRALPDTKLPLQEDIDGLAAELEARIASLVPLSSGSGGTTVTFDPASDEEFDKLKTAIFAAEDKLGDSAGDSVILQAAVTALQNREISSDGVKALISLLGSLEPSSGEVVTADRTALDALMAVAKQIADANDGTYQSVEGLSEAISTAETYLNFADGDPSADTIEMASSVLREAFASLVRLIPENEGIDVSNLTAGKYTVPISIKNAATPSQDSMANDAVEPEALITVKENGTATMDLTFKPKYLETFNQWGHLLRAWLYQGETPEIAADNAYEVKNSVLMDLSGYYTVNSDNPGEKIPMDSDPENPDDSSQYPGMVTFTMPYVSAQDGYETIYIRVSVDAMGGDSGAQNALLKIDYSQIQRLDNEGNVVESGVNRTGVTEAIAEAEKVLKDSARYTATSLNDLRVVLTSAYAVRYQEDAAQSALDEAAQRLHTAVDGLSRSVGYVDISNDSLTDTLNAGVFMEASSGAVPANAGLSAAIAAVNYDTIANKLPDDVVDFIPYSVSAVDENGSSVRADGSITVKIYVPDGWDTDKLTVYSLGNLYTSRPQEISGGSMDENGFYVFETASFGHFALAEKQESTGSGYQTGTVTFSAGEGGSLAAMVDGVEISSGDKVVYGKEVVFTATPETGYSVGSWSGVSGSGNPVNKVVDGDMNVSVSFEAKNTGSGSGGSGSGSGGGSASTDESFLKDGYYYVDIDLWKTAANEASMGNVAFNNNDRALVRVQNGKVTMVQIATNPVDVDQYHSAIIEFDISDADDVRVLETGEMTTEPAGNKYEYIRRIQFTMPDAGQPDSEDSVTYIDVRFKVPDTPMDAAVGETLDARLKFSWSTVQATDDTSLEQNSNTGSGTSSITGETITGVTLTDSATGIRLETNTERLSDKAEMTVSRLTEGAAYDTVVSAMKDIDGQWTLYQILTSVNGSVTAPEGSVTLSLPCGAEKLTIYRISDNGQRTVLRGEVKNGYYVINTSSLGLFAVMGDISDEISAEGAFTDVQNHWAKEYVDFVVERGLFNGVSETEFSPNTSMTRGMFVTVIGRLAGISAESSGATDFEDVSPDSWYAPYVAWAAENGIVTGTSDTTFTPDRAVTREEMSVLLSRYAEFAGITLKEGETVIFTDSDEISDYAEEAVAAMAGAGLIEGTGDGTFAPQKTATRAEVAALLTRFIQGYSL